MAFLVSLEPARHRLSAFSIALALLQHVAVVLPDLSYDDASLGLSTRKQDRNAAGE
jgi:hypothetical protein